MSLENKLRLRQIVLGKTDNTFIQMARNVVVTAIALLIDFGLLWGLTEHAHVYYLLSALFSALTAGLVNYALSTIWVFHKKDQKKQGWRFLVFTGIGAVGLGLNLGVLWVLTDCLGMYYMWSKVVSQTVVFFFNFFARKQFVFDRHY